MTIMRDIATEERKKGAEILEEGHTSKRWLKGLALCGPKVIDGMRSGFELLD